MSCSPCRDLIPSVASAQATTGGVKDASGGVLPGVTVEAASPNLIERVRAAVYRRVPQFRIVDLRNGTYSVTFSPRIFDGQARRHRAERRASPWLTLN